MPPKKKNTTPGIAALFLASILVIGIAVTVVILMRRPKDTEIITNRDCSAPSIDWMTISNKVDHEVLGGCDLEHCQRMRG